MVRSVVLAALCQRPQAGEACCEGCSVPAD